ncbi:MAG: hypothetical protein KDB03_18250 [Planctomycetales bacterium]|nr:hypothetical protein [Planctomycetales bacterium]
MTITRVGSTEKYASGWENVFGGKRKASKKPASKAKVVVKAAAKPAKKVAAKKKAKR